MGFWCKNCPPWPCTYNLRVEIAGHILLSPKKRSSHLPWTCDPPEQLVKSSYSRMKPSQSHLAYPMCRSGWTFCPPSFIWCHGAEDHPSPDPLGNLGSLLGSTDEQQWEVYRLNHHHHTGHSLLESCCLSSLNQDGPDKTWNPRVSTIRKTSKTHQTPMVKKWSAHFCSRCLAVWSIPCSRLPLLS